MTDPVKSLTGVVLCGGKSSRMGRDKGLLPAGSLSWAQLAIDRLSALPLPVVLSVNEQQYPHYCSVFPQLNLIADQADLPVGGPLKGILSAHLTFPDRDLLVLACDLPCMHARVLRRLIAEQTVEAAEAIVFRGEKGTEPLCGIYTSAALSRILQAVKKGELKRFSLQWILEGLKTHQLLLPPGWEPYFYNYNSPEDLLRL